MDREVWRAAIHGVAKSWTRLSDWTELNWWSHCHLLCCFGFNFINVFYVSHLEKSFSICWRAGLVVLNSLSFCLSVKLLISPSYLNEILAAAAKSLQSCPTLCNPIDGSPPGSSVPGILQARTLEWVAISFSNAWKWKNKEKSLSRVRLLATPWTAAYQAPPFMGFSKQEYWSGVPLSREDHLVFVEELVWWCWILSAFPCL